MENEKPIKRAFYDFSVSPYSYDFVSFLICARSNECTQIVFVPGERFGTDKDGNRVPYQKCTVDEQDRRLKNMLLPLCANAIVCQTREEAKALWHEGCFPPKYTVEAPTYSHLLAHVLCQKTIWPIKAPTDIVGQVRADLGENPIIIPMRECEYRTHRNSNESSWIGVAKWLEARGENVWFIPDTAHADKVYPVAKTYSLAATSILHRMAVAEIAKLTIGVNSGNMVFAFFSRFPMLYFNPIVEGSFEASEEFWERNLIPVGAQLPWFTNLQRIMWGCQDDYPDIIKALETWYAVSDGKEKWPPAKAPKFPMAGVVSNKQRSRHVQKAMETGYSTLTHRGSFHEDRLSLVCYGPSLKDTWQDLKHPIMTVSGAHDFLISKGIVPDYHVECDPRPHKVQFLKKPHHDVHYMIASCVDPEVWECLKGYKVTLWHLHNGPDSVPGIREHDPEGQLVGGGTTVGLRAFEIAGYLGFRKFDIHGMDCSYSDEGERHAGIHYGKEQGRFEICVGDNPKKFITSPQMKESAEEFMSILAPKKFTENGKTVWKKLNLDVEMYGEGLLQTMFHETHKRNEVLV